MYTEQFNHFRVGEKVTIEDLSQQKTNKFSVTNASHMDEFSKYTLDSGTGTILIIYVEKNKVSV